nr:carboxylesterase family protein [Streptomyces rhizosphaericus]
MWPSFNNGTPIAPLFNADERRLAREMTRYWGAFTKTGRPIVARQTVWHDPGHAALLRRPGTGIGASATAPVPDSAHPHCLVSTSDPVRGRRTVCSW